ncbi:hypothetical protein BDV19DRAFT_355252, partial [Aspergillus venezuelensis]
IPEPVSGPVPPHNPPTNRPPSLHPISRARGRIPFEPVPKPNSIRRRGRILPHLASGRVSSSMPPLPTITSPSVAAVLQPVRKGRYLPFVFPMVAAVPAAVFLLRKRE